MLCYFGSTTMNRERVYILFYIIIAQQILVIMIQGILVQLFDIEFEYFREDKKAFFLKKIYTQHINTGVIMVL